jgi:hypothetical protein
MRLDDRTSLGEGHGDRITTSYRIGQCHRLCRHTASKPRLCPVRAEFEDHSLGGPTSVHTAEALKAMTRWEALDSWITPNDKFFSVIHTGVPTTAESAWHGRQTGYAIDRRTEGPPAARGHLTIECSGDNGIFIRHQHDRQREVGRGFTGRGPSSSTDQERRRRSGLLLCRHRRGGDPQRDTNRLRPARTPSRRRLSIN